MPDITSNLVAWYKLDETSGTSAADSSGNGYTGTYVNSPSLNQTGAWSGGKAVTFDSSDDYVGLPTNIASGASDVTIAFWAKFNDLTQRSGLSLNYSYPASGILVRSSNFGSKISVFTDNGSEIETQSTSSVSAGVWTHIAVTGSGGTTKIYINGVLDKTAGSTPFVLSAGIASYIGARIPGAALMHGSLDDVRIYSRALSASDVSALYAYSGNPDITSGLVAHYKLDESGGTTAVDSSGNGYTGTYVNGPLLNQAGAFSGSKSVAFDGSNDHVAIATNPLYSASATAFTWAAWVSCSYTQIGSTYRILYDDVDGNSFSDTAGLTVLLDGRTNPNAMTGTKLFYATFKVAGGNRFVGTASSVSDTTQFVHFAITHSGSTTNIYINGAAVSTQVPAVVSATGNFLPKNAAVKLAALSVTAGGYTNGTLDDVRIYSRALTPGEVAYLYSVNFSTTTSILQAPVKLITEASPIMAANATYPYIFRSRTL